jgi:nucleoprotein TPR
MSFGIRLIIKLKILQFKVDSLTQQLQLSQAEAERANHDLTEKTEEFTKYRRTKHNENVALQSSLDSFTQSHAATETSFKSLQSAHTAQAHQLTQALSKVQALTGQLAEQEARYSNEANGLRRLVDMMEEREKQAKEIVENIEHEWATVGEKAERREAMLKTETERERKGREEAEKRVEQLENVLERMGRGELPVPGRSVSSTPMRASGNPDLLTDGMMGLSPTVAMASKAQRTGKTFTQVYADLVRLEEEYAKKSAEYDHMDRTLSSVLAQIEERVR